LQIIISKNRQSISFFPFPFPFSFPFPFPFLFSLSFFPSSFLISSCVAFSFTRGLFLPYPYAPHRTPSPLHSHHPRCLPPPQCPAAPRRPHLLSSHTSPSWGCPSSWASPLLRSRSWRPHSLTSHSHPTSASSLPSACPSTTTSRTTAPQQGFASSALPCRRSQPPSLCCWRLPPVDDATGVRRCRPSSSSTTTPNVVVPHPSLFLRHRRRGVGRGKTAVRGGSGSGSGGDCASKSFLILAPRTEPLPLPPHSV
jgi:hypothetical protein